MKKKGTIGTFLPKKEVKKILKFLINQNFSSIREEQNLITVFIKF